MYSEGTTIHVLATLELYTIENMAKIQEQHLFSGFEMKLRKIKAVSHSTF